MAAGEGKIKIQESSIFRGIPIIGNARWTFEVEQGIAGAPDRHILTYTTGFQLAATLAAFNAMTGSQIRAAFIAAVQADPRAVELQAASVT